MNDPTTLKSFEGHDWVPIDMMMPGDLPGVCPHEWCMLWCEDDFGRMIIIGRSVKDKWVVMGGAAIRYDRHCPELIQIDPRKDIKVTHWKRLDFPHQGSD